MDEILLLVCLALAMLVCSFLAGSLPLMVNLNEEKLQLVTALGAGLLVGAALAVIIPEGVGAVYSHQRPPTLPSSLSLDHQHLAKLPETAASADTAVAGGQAKMPLEVNGHEHAGAKADAAASSSSQHNSWIGASLVLGFVFMLLVDQLSARLTNDSSSRSQRNQFTATLGLVVHAAADGIALGASATTQHLEMEMIVFFAIMLHKAPTAFGLVTFLLHEGLERTKIRKHLLIFSLSAPIGSLLTYFLILMGNNSMLQSDNASGLVLLFSGGTFLYVATVHVLPEISHVPHGASNSLNNLETGSMPHVAGAKLPTSHLLALIVGAICPVFLSLGHAH